MCARTGEDTFGSRCGWGGCGEWNENQLIDATTQCYTLIKKLFFEKVVISKK